MSSRKNKKDNRQGWFLSVFGVDLNGNFIPVFLDGFGVLKKNGGFAECG